MESLILMTLIIPGVWSGDFGVTFTDQCALKGTSAVLKCEYDYPSGHKVTLVTWYKVQLVSGQKGLFQLSSRHKYVGDKRDDCSLQFNNIKPIDEGEYYFSFETNRNRWRSRTSAHLFVKELATVVNPSTVAEGGRVSLICEPGCPTPSSIVWFKDGQRVQEESFIARREDAGSYYCALWGKESVRSAPVALTVTYASRVTLTVSPSGGIVAESSVTLTCSSDANPPVAHSRYNLYKDGQLVSVGQSHTIPAIQPSHSGLYHCQASNDISGINSTEVHVDVQHRPMNVVVSVDPAHAAEGQRVNLTCSCAANPAADSYAWYKRSIAPGSSSLVWVGSGPVMSILSMDPSHTGFYLCQANNSLGEKRSTEVLLTMEDAGPQALHILARVGACLFLTLVVAIKIFWRKWRGPAEKKKAVTDRLSERGSRSSPNGDGSNAVYANADVFPSSPLQGRKV